MYDFDSDFDLDDFLNLFCGVPIWGRTAAIISV